MPSRVSSIKSPKASTRRSPPSASRTARKPRPTPVRAPRQLQPQATLPSLQLAMHRLMTLLRRLTKGKSKRMTPLFLKRKNRNLQTLQKKSNVKSFQRRRISRLCKLRIKMILRRPLMTKLRQTSLQPAPKVEWSQTWPKALALQMTSESEARIS